MILLMMQTVKMNLVLLMIPLVINFVFQIRLLDVRWRASYPIGDYATNVDNDWSCRQKDNYTL